MHVGAHGAQDRSVTNVVVVPDQQGDSGTQVIEWQTGLLSDPDIQAVKRYVEMELMPGACWCVV